MKKILLVFLCAALLLAGCAYTGDHDTDYKPRGDGTFPTVDTAEKDSVDYVVAALIKAGQVVRDTYALRPAGDAEQACYLRTNGIGAEIYRYKEDSETLAWIRKNGAYPIRDDTGALLSKKRAAVNGRFVLMIPGEKNARQEDVTKLNDKLEERFLALKLE